MTIYKQIIAPGIGTAAIARLKAKGITPFKVIKPAHWAIINDKKTWVKDVIEEFTWEQVEAKMSAN